MKCPFDIENKKMVIPFEEIDPYNSQNILKGYVNRRQGHLYGALWITHVNGKLCRQFIYSAPKQHYPFDKDKQEWIFPEYDTIELYEKLDGCLGYHTKIKTNIGDLPIGLIVNKRLSVKVLSYNFNLNKVEYKQILYYHKEKRIRDFLSLQIKSRLKGSKPRRIICTDNHKFWNGNRWVQSKDLNIDDNVYHYTNQLPYEVKQIILGSLLGDGSICRYSKNTRCFRFQHSLDQSEYFQYKKNLLGNLFNECKGSIGGFEGSKPNRRGTSITNASISDFIINYCEVNNKKTINKKWINEINPIALSIWYMDDGYCNFNNKQRPRAIFNTQSFSVKEVKLLKNMLKNKYNIISNIYYDKGLPILSLNADSTEILFSIIFPYICKSMKYKLPKYYEKFKCILDGITFDTYPSIIETKVIKIDKDIPSHYNNYLLYQYDIQVEGNSNYFANNILVHNTCIISYNYFDIDGNKYLTYKTRLRPFLGKSQYGNFFELWNEMRDKYPKIDKLCTRGYPYNFIFELYGKRNKILIDYDVPLDTKLIFVVSNNDGHIISPNNVSFSYDTIVPMLNGWIENTDILQDDYLHWQDRLENELNIDEDNQIMKGKEGLVWYFIKDGACKQIKCKPPSVLKYHWSGDAIAYESIYTTAINAFENFDEPSYDDVVSLLKEEFDDSKIEKSRVRIEKILGKVLFDKKYQYKLAEDYKKHGFDINKDKVTVMRFFGKNYPKSQAHRIYNLLKQYEEKEG